MRRGRGQGSQARTLGTQGSVYAITPHIKISDQSVIQCTFLLFLLYVRVLFDSGACHSFVAALCVKRFGLKG